MTEVEIESFDGVRIRAYHSPLTTSREHLVIALPVATKPSFIEEAVQRLSRQYTVITWETRLILTPQVDLSDRRALSIEAHVRDVDFLLNYFGIARACLIGYCSGASAALHIAASTNGWLQKLALINGAYFMQPEECELTQYEMDVLTLVPQVAASYDRALYIFKKFFDGNALFKRRDHEFVDEFYRPYDNVDSFYRFGLCLDNFIRNSWRDIVADVKIPTFIACGKSDDRTHYSSSMLLASQIAASEMYIDEGGDHYQFCRAEPNLIDKLTTFLSKGQA
jgi:pimeloyl-ACP methyl ester carboxylesterase